MNEHDWYEKRQRIIEAGMAEGPQPVLARDVRELMLLKGAPAAEVIPWPHREVVW